MHLGTPSLLSFLDRHRNDDALVLATVVGTEGSTYRKPGAMMLVSRDGDFEGMISGGCLEGDLTKHAARVLETGHPARVTYDMSADEDLVWSLGIGCDGVIHLLLQRIEHDREMADLLRVADAHESRRDVLVAIELGGQEESFRGSMALIDQAGNAWGEDRLLPVLREKAADWPAWRCREAKAETTRALLVRMPAPTRILICGAGPDAVPLAASFRALDWEVAIADHRPAFARPERFPAGCTVLLQRPDTIGEAVDLDGFDAAVIMTHHLENDAAYLRQLCSRPLGYLGLLGPVARKQRLRDMAGCTDRVLYGPAGLDIGAELPSSIALSIASEVHAVLNRRDGLSLTERIHE